MADDKILNHPMPGNDMADPRFYRDPATTPEQPAAPGLPSNKGDLDTGDLPKGTDPSPFNNLTGG